MTEGLPHQEAVSEGRAQLLPGPLFTLYHKKYMSSLEALGISKVGNLCLFVGRVKKNVCANCFVFQSECLPLPVHYIGLNFGNKWL